MALQGISVPRGTKDQEKAAKLAQVAQLGGTAAGFIFGGPVGASAGGAIGGAVGGQIQNKAADKAPVPQAALPESAMQRRQSAIEQDPNRVIQEAEQATAVLPPDVGAQILEQLGLAKQKLMGQR